jgi:UDP-N-acetylglucosamine 2-epimerase (non-hydrolysing)
MKTNILHCVGARPNFMKIAPIMREMSKYNSRINQVLLHTGQHYDKDMSKSFFSDLNLPDPDIYLGVGSGTHAEQTGTIMIEFEKCCLREKPGLVIVVGDVNSTLACSLVAAKLGIPVAHIEAGLRSFDWTMPEEINRVLTDKLSDFLFTTCEDADNNLIKEGLSKDKIHFVGNVMIDTRPRGSGG